MIMKQFLRNSYNSTGSRRGNVGKGVLSKCIKGLLEDTYKLSKCDGSNKTPQLQNCLPPGLFASAHLGYVHVLKHEHCNNFSDVRNL